MMIKKAVVIYYLFMRLVMLHEDTIKNFKKNRYKCNFRKFSFSLRVTNNWNSLSKTTTNAVDINQFKKLLDDELCNVMYEYD